MAAEGKKGGIVGEFAKHTGLHTIIHVFFHHTVTGLALGAGIAVFAAPVLDGIGLTTVYTAAAEAATVDAAAAATSTVTEAASLPSASDLLSGGGAVDTSLPSASELLQAGP